MAIPPSPGKITVDELQKRLDDAKAQVATVEGQLDDLKKNPHRIYEAKAYAGRGGKFPDETVDDRGRATPDATKAGPQPAPVVYDKNAVMDEKRDPRFDKGDPRFTTPYDKRDPRSDPGLPAGNTETPAGRSVAAEGFKDVKPSPINPAPVPKK